MPFMLPVMLEAHDEFGRVNQMPVKTEPPIEQVTDRRGSDPLQNFIDIEIGHWYI